ncbi:MAG: hypothetical protein Kow0092_21620 [Deferrisomatales bacterium]
MGFRGVRDVGRRIGGLAALLAAVATLLIPGACGAGSGDRGERPARQVILFLGDGMGFEQVKAGGLFVAGRAGSLAFEGFPFTGRVATGNVFGEITDSAAAATALATGVKVANGVLSLRIPGDGRPLETILERFRARGRSGGLVTTTYLTHATPAAFGAHRATRSEYAGIAEDYLTRSRPEVLLGGAKHLGRAQAEEAGYAVVTTAAELAALDTETTGRLAGLFGADHLPFEADGLGVLPHLREMTRTALAVLDNDPDGFFLLVEGGRIDHASHRNDIARTVAEVAEFSRAVAEAVAWAAAHPDTLIVVTADHETGGLTVVRSRGLGEPPEVTWSTNGHTDREVPAYAAGPGAAPVAGLLDHTDLHGILLDAAGLR